MIWDGTSPLRPEHEVSGVSTALDRVMDWLGSPNILWQHKWDDDGDNRRQHCWKITVAPNGLGGLGARRHND